MRSFYLRGHANRGCAVAVDAVSLFFCAVNFEQEQTLRDPIATIAPRPGNPEDTPNPQVFIVCSPTPNGSKRKGVYALGGSWWSSLDSASAYIPRNTNLITGVFQVQIPPEMYPPVHPSKRPTTILPLTQARKTLVCVWFCSASETRGTPVRWVHRSGREAVARGLQAGGHATPRRRRPQAPGRSHRHPQPAGSARASRRSGHLHGKGTS